MIDFLIILSFLATCVILIIISHKVFDNLILRRKNNLHLKFFRSIMTAVIVVISGYACLSQFEMTKDISKTIFQSGSLIIAIVTFAAQQTLGNVISGFSVSISKPFEVDQKVRVMNGSSIVAEGIITDITIRHTVIRQYDGQSCIVPNSIMDSSVIINTNYEADVGNFLEVEISYESDIDRAIEIFRQICLEEPCCIRKDRISILVNRMTENGVVLKTTIWTRTLDENFQVCSRIRRSLLQRFREAGVVIPYQTVTVRQVAEDTGTGAD
ncbi:MAG: mechanosensitive ion channel family protein [Lachnospiraceae bacterium]|nr:mechanosensitive ion channel family protein [Lachnospiraceae bacterium]